MQPAEPMTRRIPVRSRRQAMDWSLVLLSQGIESTIEHADESGWSLAVEARDLAPALEAIRQYQAENVRWPWRRQVYPKVAFDWASLGWVGLISVFFWFSQREPALREAGIMDGVAVSHGQWWRLFTAVFLHADLGHLAANAGIGLVFLGLAMGRYGTGAGLLASYLAGVGGNVATWLLDEPHLSLGASGMIMGSLGMLAAQSVLLPRGSRPALRFYLGGIVAGVMLLSLLGTAPGTDIMAHAGGFFCGVLIGFALLASARWLRRPWVDLLAGVLFAVLTGGAWWLALQGIPRT